MTHGFLVKREVHQPAVTHSINPLCLGSAIRGRSGVTREGDNLAGEMMRITMAVNFLVCFLVCLFLLLTDWLNCVVKGRVFLQVGWWYIWLG